MNNKSTEIGKIKVFPLMRNQQLKGELLKLQRETLFVKNSKYCFEYIIEPAMDIASLFVERGFELTNYLGEADIVIDTEILPSENFKRLRELYPQKTTFATVTDSEIIYLSPNYFIADEVWEEGCSSRYMVNIIGDIVNNPKKIINSYNIKDHEAMRKLFGLCSSYHNFEYLEEFVTSIMRLIDYDKDIFCMMYECIEGWLGYIERFFSVLLAANLYYLYKTKIDLHYNRSPLRENPAVMKNNMLEKPKSYESVIDTISAKPGLYHFIGRSETDKTIVMMNFIHILAEEGKKSLALSLEMSEASWLEKMNEHEWNTNNVVICDNAHCTVDELNSVIHAEKPDMVFIDCIQLFELHKDDADILRELKISALSVPILFAGRLDLKSCSSYLIDGKNYFYDLSFQEKNLAILSMNV